MFRFVAIVISIVVTELFFYAGTVASQPVVSGPQPAGIGSGAAAGPNGAHQLENRAAEPRAVSGGGGSGAPGGQGSTHPYFSRRVSVDGIEFGVSNSSGVYVSENGGLSWIRRDTGLPRRRVYPFDDSRVETITSLGVDPLNPRRVAVTTALGLWVSPDAGRSWSEVPLGEPIKSVAYITSVAISPWASSTYAVGTSFSGLFETTDGGRSWKALSEGLESLYRGAGFYEEIAGLSFSPVEKEVLYLGAGFGAGVYRSDRERTTWRSLDFPVGTNRDSPPVEKGGAEIIRQLAIGGEDGQPVLVVSTESRRWEYSLIERSWRAVATVPEPPPVDPVKALRIAAAENRSGLYLAPASASGESLNRMIRLAKANGLNTLVVDVKDDLGRLTYDSRVPLARSIGAVHPFFDLNELLSEAHRNGIYVVGRMVIFKDRALYAYEDHKYAVWDGSANKPWGNPIREVDPKSGVVGYVQREHWVDPFSPGVWRYNVAIAEELQALGIDEVQFDYIRFPSDGPVDEAVYRFRQAGMSRVDALESYMVTARQALHIPISTDLYGFNCWYRMGNWIGQNIEMLAQYVDAVCPMYYPSHFPEGFMEHVPYLERAREIYLFGTRRAQEIVRGRAVIRPFVQAFLLQPNEVVMDEPSYSSYLRTQLEGAQQARSSGFTLWNAASDYYMITFPLTPYVARRAAAGR